MSKYHSTDDNYIIETGLDLQFRRSARRSKGRMRKYVKDKELGLALIEAETAAHKLEMASKYRTVADKLHIISKEFSKAEANNGFDEDLKMMIKVVDTAVRSMDIERMEKAVNIYEKYFQGKEKDEQGGGEGHDKPDDINDVDETASKKSKAEELLEGVIREVSRKGTTPNQAVVIPSLAMNLAKKEKPVVEGIIREIEQDKQDDPQIDIIESSLLRRSSIYLPECEI